MKLRLALKICRELSGDPFIMRPRRTYGQIDQARHIGRKKWRDSRFPYVESEDEIQRSGDVLGSIFAGLAVQFADDSGIEVPEEIRNRAFDFSALTQPIVSREDANASAVLAKRGLESRGKLVDCTRGHRASQ